MVATLGWQYDTKSPFDPLAMRNTCTLPGAVRRVLCVRPGVEELWCRPGPHAVPKRADQDDQGVG
jgi:hypothetical protein